MWKDELKKENFSLFFPFFFLNRLAVGGLISQREGRNGSERDKDGSHVCTGWEMTYSAEIKFILLVKKTVACCVVISRVKEKLCSAQLTEEQQM